MQFKSKGDDRFAAALSAKYGGLKFHDVDGPLNGFPSAVGGYSGRQLLCSLEIERGCLGEARQGV